MNSRLQLKKLLENREPIIAPGAFDALSAKLIEQAGFPLVYISGYGSSATVIGQPDVGLLTMTEMADKAGQIASAVSIPVCADGDTGYGNVINVRRTIELYERAGVAAIQLEDQVFPKRCGHMEGKAVISTQEQIEKISVAASSRNDNNFQIIARTDARAVNGLEDAIERGKAYVEAGADILFIEAPQSIEELEIIGKTFKGVPLVANMVEHGKTPLLSKKELTKLGYQIIIYPVSLLFAATFAMQKTLQLLADDGTTKNNSQMVTFQQFNELIGLKDILDWQNQFGEKN